MKPTSVSASRNLIVIGASAPDPACSEGPAALLRYKAFYDSSLQHVEWDAILRVPHDQQDTPLHAATFLSTQLAREVEAVLNAGNFPLVVGGDHSCAIGTWSGVHHALAIVQQGAVALAR